MRLTLRTLLAWLDDLLPPQDQKILGDKISASTAAPVLIRRMRETAARSTLPAPRLDGRGLAHDPNKAAEYLENTLEPDLLEAYEKVCIESDVHLAEIAACHSLLADLIRDPAIAQPLAAEDKKRLLRAVQHHLERPRQTEREAAVADGRAVQAALAVVAEPCDTVFSSAVTLTKPASRDAARATDSDAKRRSRRAAWLTLAAAVAVLLTLTGVFVWSLTREKKSGDGRDIAAAPPPSPAMSPPASATQPRQKTVEALPPASPAKPVAAVETAVPLPASPLATSPAPQANAADVRPAEVDRSPVAVRPPVQGEQPPAAKPDGDRPAAVVTSTTAAPPSSAGVPSVEQPRVPQGDALAIAAAPPAPMAVATSPPKSLPTASAAAVLVPPAPVAAAATPGIVLDRGLLMRRDPANPDQAVFRAVRAGGAIEPGDDLLSSAVGRAVISVAGIQVDLQSHSRAVLTMDQDGTPRLELIFGRATARSSDAAARLGITAGGLAGVITAGLQAPVGIEVQLALDAGADPATAQARTTAQIVTGPSAIAWQQTQADGATVREPLQGIAAQGMLDAGTALVWESRDPGGVTIQRRSAAAWVPGRERSDWIEDAAAQALTESVADGKPVVEALQALAGNRRVENRMAAVATLALLGEYGPLVELLCAESGTLGLKPDAWTRLEQSTVPLALARGAKSAARLQQAFAAKLPGDKGTEIFALARGVSPAMLAADGGQWLVDGLEDDQLVVRRYAFKSLVDIVQPTAAERLKFAPDRPAELRREGVAWWRRQLAEGRIRHAATRGDSGAPPVE